MNEQQQQLEDLTARLRRRIASAPPLSWTAREAAAQLADLEHPNCPLSVAQKLRAVRDTLRSFKRGLQFNDPIRHHPGDRSLDE